MSQNLGKEFINVGVQSPTEFEVQSSDLHSQSISHREVVARSIEFRVDKVVDTRDSACEFNPQRICKTFIKEENFETPNNSNGLSSKKAKKKNGMEKKIDDINTIRTTSDLERKKLEAELKAAEEIAKLKQSVIEKRLELELASLQDDHPPIARSVLQPSQNELKIGDRAIKKQSLAKIEQLTSNCKGFPVQHPKPTVVPVQIIPTPFESPFFPPKPISSPTVTNQVKPKPSKNEFDCLIRRDIKALKLIAKPSNSSEQKQTKAMNSEKNQKFIIAPEKAKFMQIIEKVNMTPFQQKKRSSLQFPVNESNQAQVQEMFVAACCKDQMPEENVAPEPDTEQPECSVRVSSPCKNLAMWKSVMSKVKKKLKKTPW